MFSLSTLSIDRSCFFIRNFTTKIVPFKQKYATVVEEIAKKNIGFLVSDAWRDPDLYYHGYIEPMLSSRTCFIKLKEDKPVGFITYGKKEDITTMYYKVGSIFHLATDERSRIEGHATTLINEVLNSFKKEHITHVEVETNTLNLIPFYQRFGFTSVISIDTKTNRFAKLIAIIDPHDKKKITKFVKNRLIKYSYPYIDITIRIYPYFIPYFIPYLIYNLDFTEFY